MIRPRIPKIPGISLKKNSANKVPIAGTPAKIEAVGFGPM